MAFLKPKKPYKLPFSLFVSPNVIFSPPHKKSWSFPDRPHAWTSPLFAFTFLHGKTSPGRKGKGKAEKSIKTPPPPRRGKSPEAAAKATKAQRTGRPPSDRGGFPPWDIRTERKKGGFKGGLFPLSLLQRKKKKKGKMLFSGKRGGGGSGQVYAHGLGEMGLSLLPLGPIILTSGHLCQHVQQPPGKGKNTR